MDTPASATDSAAMPRSGEGATDGTGEDIAAREARRERMRKLAQRPRGPRKAPRQGTPAWMRRLIDEVDGLRNHAMLKRYDRELRAELKGKGAAPSEAIIELAVRQHALLDMIDATAFAESGGPVHRRKRQLHAYLKERHEIEAGWMQLRLKLGLDAETVSRPMDFSEAFRQAVLKEEREGGPSGAEQINAARQRVADHEREQREEEIDRRVREALRERGIELPVAALPAPADAPGGDAVDSPPPLPAPEAPDPSVSAHEDSVSPSETSQQRHVDVTPPEVVDLGNPPRPAPIIPKATPASVPARPPRPSDSWSQGYIDSNVGRVINGEWMPAPNLVNR